MVLSVLFCIGITNMKFLLTVSFLVLMTKAAYVYALSDAEKFAMLFERIEKLEVSDAADKREIVALKSEIRDMKMAFSEKEASFIAVINVLKSELQKDAQHVNETTFTESSTPVRDHAVNGSSILKKAPATYGQYSPKKGKRSLIVRDAVETEVAFYATHSQHDVQHLGQNQIIVFDRAVTNIGNAYNPQSGAFIAPVDGTYVFHVTMMGKDVHATTANHFNAHVDVDGAVYSQLWVEPYKQSSQMFVVELKAGKTVSVKNRVLDDGFIGQHFSSFSGFLLYEHHDSSAIVGK